MVKQKIRQGVHIMDNVTVTLTDINTGEEQSFSRHNIELNYALSALSQWIAGFNNSGYQPVYPPSKCSLGSGSGTPAKTDEALFAAISNGTANVNVANANSPSSGTTTFIFQFPAGQVTTQVTEALMTDVNGNPWFHVIFGSAFTPTSTQMITVKWEVTFS
ncbi:hypothetical protein LSG31_00280 [Fodinisporobacter ferrooxydans]|uniref:Uncharacterized protein n=1 Tax=Fodinisporobacter ferrooxydans TaxID=2901836 RepID=A0ABY4CL93_9BACL|nr:hypothetical protein LSG31_00280 [Alicyclobacillaceae bacterium MYW30-H2]